MEISSLRKMRKKELAQMCRVLCNKLLNPGNLTGIWVIQLESLELVKAK